MVRSFAPAWAGLAQDDTAAGVATRPQAVGSADKATRPGIICSADPARGVDGATRRPYQIHFVENWSSLLLNRMLKVVRDP